MKKIFICLFLFMIAAFVWVPLWMLSSGTLMGPGELSENLAPVLESGDGFAAWPIFAFYPTFQAYAELLFDTPQFFNVFWNSCKQVFTIILGHIVLGAPAAWAFARFDFRGKKVLYTLYIVLMLMPFQVTMVSSYLVLNKLGLIDTAWAIILPGAASTLPVFIMTRFFMTIPGAVTEAAAVDGASPIQTFLRLGIPLGAPGILSAVVLGFLEYWNAMEAPQAFLKDQTLWPLSLYMANITADNAGVSLIASLITLMPPLLIFMFGQKYLEQGIISSGMKD